MSATDPVMVWIAQVKEGERGAVRPLLGREPPPHGGILPPG